MNKPKLRLIIAAVAALVAELITPALSGVAHAAIPEFAQSFVRPDRMKGLTATGLMVCAEPVSTTTGANQIVVVIPTDAGATDFALNSTAANWIVDSNGLPTIGGTAATFWPGMTSGTTHATSVSGHTVTFPSADLTTGIVYCFHISATNTLTNGSATPSTNITGGTLYLQNSTGPVVMYQTNWAYTVTTDDTIVVSAVVPPNFTLALDGYTDAFTTNLDPTAVVSTGGRTATITTNAVGGWIAWAKDQYSGLHSAIANYTIDSGLLNPYPTQTKPVGSAAFDLIPSSGGIGREGYVMDVTLNTDAAGGCTVHTDPDYDDSSTGTPGTGGGTLDNVNYEPIGTCTGSAPATSDGDILNLAERAVIRGGTPAGSDYTDSITIVGAGSF